MLITEDAEHVWPVAREVFAAELAWRDQKHDALVDECEPDPLLLLEVVDVLLELILIRVSLWNERNDTRYSKR